jgi:hypothetical protein
MKTLLIVTFFLFPAMLVGQATNTVQALTSNNTSAVRTLPPDRDEGPANVSKLPIRSLLYPGATTKILVRYMAWFGSSKHKDLGYRSDDAAQVRRQVEDMISRGIDGAIVAWYGPDNEIVNRSTKLLLAEAERHPGFSVALSIDTGAFDPCDKQHCDVTDEMIRLLHYVEKNFESSPAYLRTNGRPLVTSCGLEKRDIDWHRVRQEARNNPLFVFRNSGGFKQPESDGAFSWVAPRNSKRWRSDGDGLPEPIQFSRPSLGRKADHRVSLQGLRRFAGELGQRQAHCRKLRRDVAGHLRDHQPDVLVAQAVALPIDSDLERLRRRNCYRTGNRKLRFVARGTTRHETAVEAERLA